VPLQDSIFTKIHLSQGKVVGSSKEEQCADLRRSLNLPDADTLRPGTVRKYYTVTVSRGGGGDQTTQTIVNQIHLSFRGS